MSKIGKKQINIPIGVDIKINDGLVTVKGPKGELGASFPNTLSAEIKDNILQISPSGITSKKRGDVFSFWGLTRALIQNMILGVTDGFEKGLEFQGVGYKAVVKGNDLVLELGYSHPITVTAPEGISFKVEKSSIKIIGINKDLVGRVAAHIRSKRGPEPYQGSGIRYSTEVIRRKAGKKAASTA
jgi:large subunit ribosomal protein L6